MIGDEVGERGDAPVVHLEEVHDVYHRPVGQCDLDLGSDARPVGQHRPERAGSGGGSLDGAAVEGIDRRSTHYLTAQADEAGIVSEDRAHLHVATLHVVEVAAHDGERIVFPPVHEPDAVTCVPLGKVGVFLP